MDRKVKTMIQTTKTEEGKVSRIWNTHRIPIKTMTIADLEQINLRNLQTRQNQISNHFQNLSRD